MQQKSKAAIEMTVLEQEQEYNPYSATKSKYAEVLDG